MIVRGTHTRAAAAGFSTLLAVTAACLAMLAPGCVSHRNERLVIGTRATASFGPGGPGMARSQPTGPDGAGGRTVRAFSSDPVRLDRSRWRTMVVVSPIDGVVHTETFRGVAVVGRRAPAARAGVFPPVDAEPAGSWTRDLAASGGELGRAVMDPFLAPLRLLRAARGGWWTWSPYEIWKRTRHDRTRWSAVGGRRQERSDE